MFLLPDGVMARCCCIAIASAPAAPVAAAASPLPSVRLLLPSAASGVGAKTPSDVGERCAGDASALLTSPPSPLTARDSQFRLRRDATRLRAAT